MQAVLGLAKPDPGDDRLDLLIGNTRLMTLPRGWSVNHATHAHVVELLSLVHERACEAERAGLLSEGLAANGLPDRRYCDCALRIIRPHSLRSSSN